MYFSTHSNGFENCILFSYTNLIEHFVSVETELENKAIFDRVCQPTNTSDEKTLSPFLLGWPRFSVGKTYQKAPYFKVINLLKQNLQLYYLWKPKFWLLLVCVVLYTRFRALFLIVTSQKYCKLTICLVFYGLQNEVSNNTSAFKGLNLPLPTPIWGWRAKLFTILLCQKVL